MEAFKERLIQEYVELDERTEKLEEFILKNPKFESLETEIQTSMLAQKEAMKTYQHVLKHRMKLLGITHDDVVAYKHPYQNLSFGEALQALEAGKCVKRESWVGDKFLLMRKGTMVKGEDVPKIKINSGKFKAFYWEDKRWCSSFHAFSLLCEQFSEWSEAKDYSPNGEDLFSRDWMVL